MSEKKQQLLNKAIKDSETALSSAQTKLNTMLETLDSDNEQVKKQQDIVALWNKINDIRTNNLNKQAASAENEGLLDAEYELLEKEKEDDWELLGGRKKTRRRRNRKSRRRRRKTQYKRK